MNVTREGWEMAMKGIQTWIWNNFGHCLYCMRVSFRIFAVAFAVLLISAALYGSSWVTFVTSCVAIALASIWVGHLIVFSIKTSSSARESIDDRYRRNFILAFANAFTFATIASTAASAQATGFTHFSSR